MKPPVFQPFSDRLSRDIRNGLSHSLVKALHKRSLMPVQELAARYLGELPAGVYTEYIEERLRRYESVFAKLLEATGDPLLQGLILWDVYCFFEVHDVLEPAWLHAQGEEKVFLQAVIRAAAVYIKRDAGYPEAAVKIAGKALPVLKNCRQQLARLTDPELLINALENIDSDPPKLLDYQNQRER